MEAVALYLELQPDLVTMDIVMPKRSGIEAVRGILAEDPRAQVVMCSALGQETLVMEALQAGAKNFIVKPFKPDAVISTLDRLVEKEDMVGA
jgi:two-component system chemotaxis response regulator CheY